MRTNIHIDDALLAEAMAIMASPTKKAAVEEALRRVVTQHQRIKALDEAVGIGWEGDLDAMREGRDFGEIP